MDELRAKQVSFRSVFLNTVWMSAAKLFSVALRALLIPILARLLTPADFGLVGASLALVVLFAMITSGGLSRALIVLAPPRDVEPATWDTVFWATSVLAVVTAVAIVAGADVLAWALGHPPAAAVLASLAGLLVLMVVGGFVKAELLKSLRFQRVATIDIVASSLAGTIAIALAFAGAGVWALVAQYYVLHGATLIGLLILTRFVPTWRFDRRALARLLPYAGRTVLVDFLTWTSFRAPVLILMRLSGPTAAGAWTAARTFINVPQEVTRTSFLEVLMPTFSSLKDDGNRLAAGFRSSVHMTMLVQAPLLLGIAAVAEPGMAVVFGPQWAAQWPLLGLLALAAAFNIPMPLVTAFLQGVGRADWLLRLKIFQTVLSLTGVLVGALVGGTIGAAIGLCVIMPICMPVFLWTACRCTGLPMPATALYVLRPFCWAVLMALIVRVAVDQFMAAGWSTLATLLITVPIGGAFYPLMVALAEPDVWKILRKLRKR